MQPLEDPRRPGQPLERPGERGRRRLVAGDEQRHQLVAELAVAERLAFLVAGGEQQREDVVAVGAVRIGPPSADLLEEDGVGPVARPEEPPPGAEPAVAAGRQADPEDAERASDQVEQLPQRRADGIEPVGPVGRRRRPAGSPRG